MRKVTVLDTTLRDGEQAPGCSMNLEEKRQMALQLERLRVDVIEAGFPVASPDDFQAVQTIARTVKDCGVAAMCRANQSDIMQAWEAVRHAKRPRLHMVLSASDIHLEHKLHMSRQQLLEHAVASVRFAKRLCPEIQYSPEDCTRADRAFLMEVINAVVDAGVTLVNLTDTVGYLTPMEAADLVRFVKENLKKPLVPVGIHCHNDLGMAVANTISAVQAGADHVECTVGGIGERAGNAALEEVVMALRTRGDFVGCGTGINTQELYAANQLLYRILNKEIPANKAIVGENAFAHEAGIHQHGVLSNPLTYEIMSPQDVGLPRRRLVLGKHSGRAALRKRLEELGYTLDAQALEQLCVLVKRLADEKKQITDWDLERLAQSCLPQESHGLRSVMGGKGKWMPAAVNGK